MNQSCSQCHYRYERDPGYFLGSTYVNYGATALSVTVGYIVCLFVLRVPQQNLVVPFAVYVVLFPLIFFRYARSLWMAIDMFFDRSAWNRDEEESETID